MLQFCFHNNEELEKWLKTNPPALQSDVGQHVQTQASRKPDTRQCKLQNSVTWASR